MTLRQAQGDRDTRDELARQFRALGLDDVEAGIAADLTLKACEDAANAVANTAGTAPSVKICSLVLIRASELLGNSFSTTAHSFADKLAQQFGAPA